MLHEEWPGTHFALTAVIILPSIVDHSGITGVDELASFHLAGYQSRPQCYKLTAFVSFCFFFSHPLTCVVAIPQPTLGRITA